MNNQRNQPSGVFEWFDERLDLQRIVDDISEKYVPPHVNIFYCLGGLTFTCFIVQIATGFAMTFFIRRQLVKRIVRFNVY